MRRFLLPWVILIAAACAGLGQTPSDPNGGSRLTHNSTTGACSLSWWGRAGMRYFILQSDDLFTWNYIPAIIETGTDQIIAWGFTTSAERFFLRLEVQVDPFGTDSDGDGLSDGDEILNAGVVGGQVGTGYGLTDPRLKDHPAVQLSAFGFVAP